MHSRLLPLLVLCSSSLLAATTSAQEYLESFKIECESNTNYTRGSAFQANLESLLTSFPSAAAASQGFAENVTGAAPDQAFGRAQCRRDLSASVCSDCVDTLAKKLYRGCPGQKSAIIIAKACQVRQSNVSLFGIADPSLLLWYVSGKNVTQLERFTMQLSPLLNNLTSKAAHGSLRKFAAGAVDLPPFGKIYAMAQCTGDLYPDDCYSCLDRGLGYIPSKCGNKDGCSLMFGSCFIQFESGLFYNVSAAAEASMSSSPAPASGDGSSNHSSQGSTGISSTVRTALLVTVPVAVTLLVFLFVAVFTCKKNRKPHRHVLVASNGHGDEEIGSLHSPLQYDLSTLRSATDNFSEQNTLGRGGFGRVYKGTLQNGQNIAVKRLSTASQQGQAEMKNEIFLVAKLQHKNLVCLLGYCIEQDERLLVYEFLSNKSLDKIIYGPTGQQELSWAQRYKIIKGIGRGLLYLHEDSRLKIIHRDLKPSNILLDANMNPKISDFGFAKLFNIDSSVRNTSHKAGTFGYMAPEYIRNGLVSAKADVFSYGVLLLELIIGQRPSEDLIKNVWSHWSQGNVSLLWESSCPANEHGRQEMLRCIQIGLLCVQDDKEQRACMADVVLMLNSHSIPLVAPTEPVFAATGEMPRAATLKPSINEVSISELEPR